MPFVPRTVNEIIRKIAGRVVARSALTDLAKGSSLLALVTAVAEEIGNLELRLMRIRNSFYLQGVAGSLLDERAREFPPDGLARLGATSASGAVLIFTRDPTTVGVPFTLQAGTTVRRIDDASQVYRVAESVPFLAGEHTNASSPARAVALVPGSRGNCDAGTIRKGDNLPPEIVAVDNIAGLYNGTDSESDGQLKTRLLAYLGSLARAQPSALRFLGLSFLSSDNIRARYVFVWEDPARPGYTEVVLDDGTGGAGGTRAGATTSGTVPEAGALLLYHEKPAVNPIDRVLITRGGSPLVLTEAAGDFISLPERGVVLFDSGVLIAGDVWEISTDANGEQYQVYTGLVAEMQQRIEGDPSNPAERPGWRAAGTRVRVVPAQVEWVSFDVRILPESGTAIADLTGTVRSEAVRFLQSLAPGDTLFIAQLIEHLMGIAGLASVTLFNADGVSLLTDQVPSSRRKALRTTTSRIEIRPATEE